MAPRSPRFQTEHQLTKYLSHGRLPCPRNTYKREAALNPRISKECRLVKFRLTESFRQRNRTFFAQALIFMMVMNLAFCKRKSNYSTLYIAVSLMLLGAFGEA